MLGTVKEKYTELMINKVKHIPSLNYPIVIHYKVFVGSNTKSDVMNWVSVIDKFFQDVLVKQGIIPDDNYTVIPKIVSEFGGIDKKNPRIEITIEETKERENTETKTNTEKPTLNLFS